MDQLQAQPISGTEGGTNPFLSPDDRWIGFYAPGTPGMLKKVSISGGVPVPLCDVENNEWFGASWGPDNTIVFSKSYDGGIYQVSADGGKPEVLTTPAKTREEFGHKHPHWLPDGSGVLFTNMREQFDLEPQVAFLDLNTRKWSVLLENAADARYIPSGHMVFVRQGTLMLVPFELRKHRVAGQPVPVVVGVMQGLNAVSGNSVETAAGQYSVSDSGGLVYAPGGMFPDMDSTLLWVDQKGNEQPAAPLKARFCVIRLSPDGRKLAHTVLQKDCRAWVYDFNRGTPTPLTSGGKSWSITWTPDGKRLVFDWGKFLGPASRLYWQASDGSSLMERMPTGEGEQSRGAAFTPDGTIMAFVEGPHNRGQRIHLLDLRDGRITPFGISDVDAMSPTFSPNGHWIAYASGGEIWVKPFRGPGGNWKISNEGGNQPLWSRDGKQLFYRRARVEGAGTFAQVWAVDIQADGAFNPSKPRLLIEKPYVFQNNIPNCWDIAPDGRFLMVKIVEKKSEPVIELIFVQNWIDELKQRTLVK
jgi:eukaryotic-like serine/threonine-protein kinase